MSYITDWITAVFHAAQTGTVWVGVGLVLAVAMLVLASERGRS